MIHRPTLVLCVFPDDRPRFSEFRRNVTAGLDTNLRHVVTLIARSARGGYNVEFHPTERILRFVQALAVESSFYLAYISEWIEWFQREKAAVAKHAPELRDISNDCSHVMQPPRP